MLNIKNKLKKIIYSWRYLLSIATMLAILLQIMAPFSYLPIAPVAHAATITVNTTDDELNADGDCSLREAIRAANTNGTVDACVGGPGDDTIELPAGTYTLTLTGAGEDAAATGDLDIVNGAGNLTITGAGAGTTIIDGNSSDRIFQMNPANGAPFTVEISNVTIQNGNIAGEGGGIWIRRVNVTLNNVVIRDNAANGGNGGGGIFFRPNAEVLEINNSAIIGNQTNVEGGGIYVRGGGTANLNNVTLSGNEADDGGGIAQTRNAPTTNLNNVTLADNMATNNGGGVYLTAATGNINLKNTIVAGNNGGNGPDCNGGLTSLDNNIIGDTTGCGIAAQPNDQFDTTPLINPFFVADGDTFVHPLLPGSPAVDAADDGVVTCSGNDQRGQARFDVPGVGVAICDIGAYEFTGPIPDITITDESLIEGDTPGAPVMNFTIELAPTIAMTVTVDFTTVDNSTQAGLDYVANTGTLQIPPNTPTQTISVTLNGDTDVEINENFFVNLTNATWANVSDPQGIGTIIDDDGVSVSIADATAVVEGDPPGTTTVSFPVSLSIASGSTVTVTYQTANGTATAGSDYTAVSAGQLVFLPGETTKNIDIGVLPDTTFESTETFSVTLTGATNATVNAAQDQGVGTITDDDGVTVPLPSISINDPTVTEGNSGTTPVIFEVRLSAASTTTITIDYTTGGGTAVPGEDYQAASGALTFPPGVTVQTISITINGDTTAEQNETFGVILSNPTPTGVTITKGEGMATITNDDAAPPTDSGGGDGSKKDDDDDDSSPPPPPPAAAPAPPAEPQLPVAALPETGLRPPRSSTPWSLITLLGLTGIVALTWVIYSRRSREKIVPSDRPPAGDPIPDSTTLHHDSKPNKQA